MTLRTPLRTDKTLAELIEVIPDAALIVNTKGHIVLVNRMLVNMFGYQRRKDMVGQSMNILLPDQVRQHHDQHMRYFFEQGENRPMGKGFKFAGIKANGDTIYVDIMLSHVEFDGKNFAIAFIRDTTSNKIVEDRIRRELERERKLAMTDHLTGLENRRAFVEELEGNIQSLAEHGWQFAVCFIDLDDFKLVNDNLGHQIGDDVLQKVAHILKANCRGSDLVARIGGDEFATIHAGASLQDAMHVLERVRSSIVQELSADKIPVTLSMGLCHCYEQQRHYSVSGILSAADQAMYEAKQQGKNQIKIACVDADLDSQ